MYKIYIANSILGLILFLNPLMALIYMQYNEAYKYVNFLILFSLFLIAIEKRIFPSLQNVITIPFVILIIYTLLINAFYIESVVEILKLPLVLISLFLSFSISKYLSSANKINKKFLIWFSIWIVSVTLLLILIDKLNGVTYYSYESFTTNRSIVGNFSKLAKVLFIVVPILSYTSTYIFLFIGALGIMLTLRRTIILAEIIFFVVLTYGYVKNKYRISKKIKLGAIVLIGLIFFIFLYTTVGESILSRFMQIEAGKGSGRFIIWDLAINNYSQYNLVEQIFANSE